MTAALYAVLVVLAAEPTASGGSPATGATTATATTTTSSASSAGAIPGATAATPAPAISESLPGMTGTPVRVENRILVKQQRFFATGGLSYLSRGDYYLAPGISAAGSFFLNEGHGLEARLDVFVAWMAPGAAEVFNATGLLPDAHRPIARFAVGYRNSIAYGKVMAFGSQLLHFELHGSAHVGMLVTDRASAPALAVGPGLLVRLNQSLYAQLDVPLFVSLEPRQSGLVSIGSLPTFTIGIRP